MQIRSWAAAGAVGFCLAVVSFNQILETSLWSVWQKWAYLLVGTVVLGGGVHRLTFGPVARWLSPYSSRVCRLWIVAGLAVGTMARVVIPIYPAERTNQVHLVIVATGEKNPAASASEVWVYGLFDAEGDRLVPATAFARTGAWTVRDGVAVSHEQQPGTLSWEGALPRDVELRLLSHPWSGMVRVESRGGTRQLDLYAATERMKKLSLRGGRPRVWWEQALLETAMVVSLGVLALVL